jgi:uncharacterized protein
LTRTIANPLPLGFLALAAGTFVLAGLQLDWVDPEEGTNVALILIAFVVPLQLLSSVLGFVRDDGIAGTAMGILAGAWLAIGLVTLTSPPGSTSDALGLFLLVAAVALAVPSVGGAAEGRLAVAVPALAAVRFATAGVVQLTASASWEELTGIVGLVLTALAVYAALTLLLSEARD